MIGSFLIPIALLATQLPETSKSKVDRSGEAALREMLASIAAKTAYHGMIWKSHRESGAVDFYPDGIVEIWREDGKFRVQFDDMWGTSNLVVCDGKRVLDDGGADPVVLRNPGKTWIECSSSLDAKGPVSSPWFFLIEGPRLLERMGKGESITQNPTTKAVVWNTKEFGSLSISHVFSGRDRDVWELEFDNMPWQQEMFRLAPEWFDSPDPTAVTRHRIVLARTQPPKGAFDTKIGKGRQIDDQTQMAKKPPRLY